MTTPAPLAAALAGRYDLDREIGEGGMATVYLARDVRHGRSVALKVLKPELGAVLGADRFLTEIQVTAQLQHPNLLPLFDSGEAAGLLFYVMPFVEGETLRARLDREKQLPVDEALRITAALAAALQYAHDRGVIHRDLKPENILLQAGQPVIADFGIALAVSNAGGARVTQTGLSLGTPQYMSPEQATGDRSIDARTDVYSLAAMTYEMLTGEPPHAGATAQSIIAKLMTEEPRPVSVLRKSVPPHVEAAIARALEKLPADRLPSAAAFAAALSGEKPVAPTSTQRAAATSTRVRWREGVAWLGAAAALVFALWPRERATPVAPVAGRFEVGFPDSLRIGYNGSGPQFALARDGGVLVAAARSTSGLVALWMRRADDPTWRIIPGTSGATYPSLSPDGQWVVFKDGQGAVRKLALSGGAPITIIQAAGAAVRRSSSWSVNNQLLVEAPGGAIVQTDAEGRGTRTVIAADSANGHRRTYVQPDWLPGGTHALVIIAHYTRAKFDSTVIGVLDVTDGTVRSLALRGFAPRYVASGHLVFVEQNAVLAVPFSAATRKLLGTPTRIVERVNVIVVDPVLAVADNGWMIAGLPSSAAQTSRVELVTRTGQGQLLTDDRRWWHQPRVSPDGRRVALQAWGGVFNRGDVWILDVPTGGVSRLTTDGWSYRPRWSRDGRLVYFVRTDSATRVTSFFRRPWDGSGADELLLSKAELAEIEPGAVNGLSAIRTLGARDTYLAPTESLSTMRPFVAGPPNETDPAISPDGRWLAYQSDESERVEVYLRPMPGPGARLSVSTSGGAQPRWSRDGRRLYYRAPGQLMVADVEYRDGTAVVTRRDSLFADDPDGDGSQIGDYDVMPDGSGFVFVRGSGALRMSVTLIPNWQALLRRAPGTP